MKKLMAGLILAVAALPVMPVMASDKHHGGHFERYSRHDNGHHYGNWRRHKHFKRGRHHYYTPRYSSYRRHYYRDRDRDYDNDSHWGIIFHYFD